MSALTVGARLGRYELTADLGPSALGPVFFGVDTRNDRQVVVRSVGPELIEERTLWRNLREAVTRVRRLDHPTPAQILDVVDTPQAKAIIEERIDGRSLAAELDERGGSMPPHRAYALFVRIAEAVQAAHDLGVPHWRLSPHAVLISEAHQREAVRITGFGVGAALAEAGISAAATKSMPVHLAYYLAPDQVHRGMSTSPRADVYALGVMLYEALTGYVPFGGDDLYSVVRAHLMEAPPSPRTLAAGIPWHVEAVVLRALAKHPDDRQASPAELAMYLRGCASGAVVAPAARAASEVEAAPPVSGQGVRVRREASPPPLPPPLPTAATLESAPAAPQAPPPAHPDEDDDIPTQVRALADFEAAPEEDDDIGEESTLPVLDAAVLIPVAVPPSEAAAPVDPGPGDPVEAPPPLPVGVPNPSYLALLTPRN